MNDQDQRVRVYYKNLSLPQDKLELLLKIEPAEKADILRNKQQDDVAQHRLGRWASVNQWLCCFNPARWQWNRWVPAVFACTFVLLASLWVHDSSSVSGTRRSCPNPRAQGDLWSHPEGLLRLMLRVELVRDQ